MFPSTTQLLQESGFQNKEKFKQNRKATVGGENTSLPTIVSKFPQSPANDEGHQEEKLLTIQVGKFGDLAMVPGEDRDISGVLCNGVHHLKNPFSPGDLQSGDELHFQGILKSSLEAGIRTLPSQVVFPFLNCFEANCFPSFATQNTPCAAAKMEKQLSPPLFQPKEMVGWGVGVLSLLHWPFKPI